MYLSTWVMRSPAPPASATVVACFGLALDPDPLTPLWLTAVNAVRVPRLLVALLSWFVKSGV